MGQGDVGTQQLLGPQFRLWGTPTTEVQLTGPRRAPG